MIRVLSIGQLPKEVGGNYTTGVARVVHELSLQEIPGVTQFLYASNIAEDRAKKLCKYPFQYIGYRKYAIRILFNIVFHPFRTKRQWTHYRQVCHMNPLRMEFHRVNIEEAIRRVKPDIIHNHSAFLSSSYFASLGYNIPIIRTYHGLVYKGVADTRYQNVADEAKGTVSFADYYTALTKENAQEIVRIGVDAGKVTIIPNGIDSRKYYYSPEERKVFRSEFNLYDTTVVFMTVGRLIDRKGQLMFLKFLALQDIDFRYWIFGIGPDYEPIKAFIVENHLENKVELFGQVAGNELYKYYSAADFYAHVSTTEGQSLAEIEAYSSGLRIIVNSLIVGTVIGNAVDDHDNYFVLDFDQYDIKQFKSWISTPYVDRVSRKSCDWSIIARQYGQLYQRILIERDAK